MSKKLFISIIVGVVVCFAIILTLTICLREASNPATVSIEISEDGYWVIDGVKTQYVAVAKDGANGIDGATPTIDISNDGYWVINGIKTGYVAIGRDGADGVDGVDGVTPTIEISADGYWVINGVKTEHVAIGKDGADGVDGVTPTIEISEDGYWVINGVKTDVRTEFCDHIWETVTTVPTCTAGGYDTITCKICDKSYTDNETEQLEHTYESVYTIDDDYHWYKCVGCDDVKDKAVHTLNDDGICTACEMKSVVKPEVQYINIDNLDGMTISQAKSVLESAGVQYEIIPTESRMANQIERFEFLGNETEDGKFMIEYGTTVKIYGNDVSKDKVIYLTFDDGPTRDNTNEIVMKLEEYGIKASFFCEGRDIERYPDRMETIFNRGHVIACHSHTHEFENVYSSINAFISEVTQYENALLEALGEENFAKVKKIIRFPGGTNNAYLETDEEALTYIAAVRELGYTVYDWTALTGDAEGNSDAQSFISTLDSGLTKAKNNELDLIVLMHDKWSTNEALGEILDHLIEQGYYFDTIDHCPEYTFVEN